MATRSNIAVKIGNKVNKVYCHFDGYPSHHLPILQEAYNSQERAEALVRPGNMSNLDVNCDKPEGHSFDNRMDGYTTYYGRDRGETGIEGRMFDNVDHAAYTVEEEYLYLWDGHSWAWTMGDGRWFIDLGASQEIDIDRREQAPPAPPAYAAQF